MRLVITKTDLAKTQQMSGSFEKLNNEFKLAELEARKTQLIQQYNIWI